MKWTPYPEIKDCGALESTLFEDELGTAMRVYGREDVARAGIPVPWGWAENHVSFTEGGCVRGFTLQTKIPQGKLVTILAGKIMEVLVDVRQDSPTFMNATRVVLESSNPFSFYVPPGVAHAFEAIEPSLVMVQTSIPTVPAYVRGFHAYSVQVAHLWNGTHCRLSTRDGALPSLVDYLNAFN